MTRFLQPPLRVRTVKALSAAFVIALITWYAGADALHAILFGAVIATLATVALTVTTPAAQEDEDRWRRTGSAYRRGSRRRGSRHDIEELSRALRGRWGLVSFTAVWRVQKLAQRRLDPYGLSLAVPADRRAIRALVGRRAYSVLMRSTGEPAPTRGTLLRCLDRLDALAEGPPTQTTPNTARGQPSRARARTKRQSRLRRNDG